VAARAAYLAWPISVLLGALVILWGRLPVAEPTPATAPAVSTDPGSAAQS
jgi:hypothetical protein